MRVLETCYRGGARWFLVAALALLLSGGLFATQAAVSTPGVAAETSESCDFSTDPNSYVCINVDFNPDGAAGGYLNGAYVIHGQYDGTNICNYHTVVEIQTADRTIISRTEYPVSANCTPLRAYQYVPLGGVHVVPGMAVCGTFYQDGASQGRTCKIFG